LEDSVREFLRESTYHQHVEEFWRMLEAPIRGIILPTAKIVQFLKDIVEELWRSAGRWVRGVGGYILGLIEL
jgi:hypothetical protein